jgi:hypothetical protein
VRGAQTGYSCAGTKLPISTQMRPTILLAILCLTACTEAFISRIDDRTFAIEGPNMPSASDAPNRRLASQACPKGYRIVDETTRRNTPDGIRDETGYFTNWTIRCL